MESATQSVGQLLTWRFSRRRVNRYEIIDGELLVTRAPDWKHQAVCINIGTMLKLWSDESGLGQPAVTPGIVFQNQIMSSLMSSGQVTNVWNGCLMKQDIRCPRAGR